MSYPNMRPLVAATMHVITTEAVILPLTAPLTGPSTAKPPTAMSAALSRSPRKMKNLKTAGANPDDQPFLSTLSRQEKRALNLYTETWWELHDREKGP